MCIGRYFAPLWAYSISLFYVPIFTLNSLSWLAALSLPCLRMSPISGSGSGDGMLNSSASLEQCQLALPSRLSQGVPCRASMGLLAQRHQTWFSGAFSFREKKGHWSLAHKECPCTSLRKGHSCRLRAGRRAHPHFPPLPKGVCCEINGGGSPPCGIPTLGPNCATQAFGSESWREQRSGEYLIPKLVSDPLSRSSELL